MADVRCNRCQGVGEAVAGRGHPAICPCVAGVRLAAEGTACVDCHTEFHAGDVCLEVALARLTGLRAAVFSQCLGCAAYEQVLGLRVQAAGPVLSATTATARQHAVVPPPP
jgi:hypothetical protein